MPDPIDYPAVQLDGPSVPLAVTGAEDASNTRNELVAPESLIAD